MRLVSYNVVIFFILFSTEVFSQEKVEFNKDVLVDINEFIDLYKNNNYPIYLEERSINKYAGNYYNFDKHGRMTYCQKLPAEGDQKKSFRKTETGYLIINNYKPFIIDYHKVATDNIKGAIVDNVNKYQKIKGTIFELKLFRKKGEEGNDYMLSLLKNVESSSVRDIYNESVPPFVYEMIRKMYGCLLSTEMLSSFAVDEKIKQNIIEVINKCSLKYGLNTKERMINFLAQIGHESSNFKSRVENVNYSLKNIYDIVLKPNKLKIGDIYTFKYSGVIKGFKPSDICSTPNFIIAEGNKDYIELDVDTKENRKTGQKHAVIIWDYDTFKSKGYAINQEYTGAMLLNYWYACRNGNGDITTGDGFKYRGRGFIQITGRDNYTDILKKLKVKDTVSEDDLDEFIEGLSNDTKVDMEASMAYWSTKRNVHGEIRNGNDWADEIQKARNQNFNQNFEGITIFVNGGLNELEKRKAIYDTLKNLWKNK